MITRIFFYCGVAVLAGELCLLACNLRRVFARGEDGGLKKFAAWALGMGGVCAAASLFIRYPYSDDIRIHGFPFAAAAMRYENGCWVDYVGPLTGLYTFLNAAVFFLLPQVALFVFAALRARTRQPPS